MNKERKARLIELGAETLADALLQLTVQNDAACEMVERMTSTPEENIEHFKAKLRSLKRSRRFVGWGESAAFARKLVGLLQDLRAGIDDPKAGSQLVVVFYETDNGVLGNCDDSSGHIGDVYRYEAKELFISYAKRCLDKALLTKLVFKLNKKDGYGVRDTLIDCAAEYLPESNIRTLIDILQKAANKEEDDDGKQHWMFLIASLARQIKDAQLFETTRIAFWGSLSTAACVDIAQVYLESGEPETALTWIEKISLDETFLANERNQLLLEIYGQLGATENQQEVAWRIFKRHRSGDSLEELLAVIGNQQRESVIQAESSLIMSTQTLSLSDTAFLVAMGLLDEAEQYLLERVDQLNGDFYGNLLFLADAMDVNERHLGGVVLYRALLDSILRRAKTKTYSYGVGYLKKLDRLANFVTNWRGLDDHTSYLQQLRQDHGRKYRFWSKYEG